MKFTPEAKHALIGVIVTVALAAIGFALIPERVQVDGQDQTSGGAVFGAFLVIGALFVGGHTFRYGRRNWPKLKTWFAEQNKRDA